MRKAWRNPELSMAFRCQLDPDPSTELRGATANVDSDVPDRAVEDLHQLPLARGFLEVESAQRPASRARQVILDEGPREARRRIALRLKRLDEKAAGVAINLWLNK